MAYTPINWQTGDTITADKLNRCDNGWGVESTQLFSETVTTTDTGQGFAAGQLEYEFQGEPPSEAVITFDGTSYTVERNERGGYGDAGASGPDFTNYPFHIAVFNGTQIYTATAGTYTVALTAETVVTSNGFNAAVNAVVGDDRSPFLCVHGETTSDEVHEAYEAMRLLYFMAGDSTYIVRSLADYPSVTFYPEDSSVTAKFDNDDIFEVVIS